MKKNKQFTVVFSFAFVMMLAWTVVASNAAQLYTISPNGTVNATSATKMATTYVNTGAEAAFSKFQSNIMNGKAYAIQMPKGDSGIVPITISRKGAIRMVTETLNVTGSSVAVYTDAACTKRLAGTNVEKLDSGYMNTSGSMSYTFDYIKNWYFPKAATYYVKFTTGAPDAESSIFYFTSVHANSADRTIKANSYFLSYGNGYTYYKFVVPKDGVVKLYQTTNATGAKPILYATLLDSRKKAISYQLGLTTGHFYGLKRGTYYFRVKTSPNNCYYRMKYTFTAVSDISGNTRARARTMVRGRFYKGLMTGGGSSVADWYKFNLPRNSYFTVDFSSTRAYRSDFTVKIYDSRGRTRYTGTNSGARAITKFPKGIYYISVTRKSTVSSGYYSLRFR